MKLIKMCIINNNNNKKKSCLEGIFLFQTGTTVVRAELIKKVKQ